MTRSFEGVGCCIKDGTFDVNETNLSSDHVAVVDLILVKIYLAETQLRLDLHKATLHLV